jgi:hypothetical protein
MDDSERLAEALKYYGKNLPNFGEPNQENDIQKFLKNIQFSGGGGGGKESGGVFGGGRIGYEFPINETSSISPYVQGFIGKPVNQPITGGVTGFGLNYRKRF